MEEWGTIITTITTILPFPTKEGRYKEYALPDVEDPPSFAMRKGSSPNTVIVQPTPFYLNHSGPSHILTGPGDSVVGSKKSRRYHLKWC